MWFDTDNTPHYVHSWIPPSDDMTDILAVAMKEMCSALPGAEITMGALEMAAATGIKEGVKVTWQTKAYRMWVPEEDASAEDGVEDEWVDQESGERFVVDHVREEDVEKILSCSTVDYGPPYIHTLLTTPPFSTLHRAIRSIPSSQSPSPAPAISWCLMHLTASYGLVGTLPSYRGKGLAKKAVRAVVKAHKDSDGLRMRPHAHIAVGNEASEKLFGGLGWRVVGAD
ncbi:hypothetical protein HK104_007130, partial [Borealophlyctis nickersoniae]